MRQLNNKGFTLIEVLIVVAIFAIGAAIAIPNIMDMGKSSGVKSDARKLKDQIARARMTAIERNQSIVIVFNQDGDVTTNDYIIFEDRNDNDIYNNATDIIVIEDTLQANVDSTGLSSNTEPKDYLGWDTKGLPASFGVGTQTITVSSYGRSFDVVVSMMGGARIDD
jgi:prepilin-type N-terminal cleavage/methylation domain-containing protein